MVRVGNPAKVRDDLRSATLEALAEGSRRGQTAAMRRARSEELRRNAEEGATAQPPMSKEEQMSLLRAAGDEWRAAEDLMRDATKEQLDAAQVVVCTCSGAGSPMMQGRTFKIVLIDEATQVMAEPVRPSLSPFAPLPLVSIPALCRPSATDAANQSTPRPFILNSPYLSISHPTSFCPLPLPSQHASPPLSLPMYWETNLVPLACSAFSIAGNGAINTGSPDEGG